MVKNCRICGTEFEYCGNCTLKHIHYKKQGMCSNACYEISNILQRYRCNLITADDAVLALEPYDMDSKQLQPKIAECYQDILDKATKPIEEVVPEEDVEVVILYGEDTTTSEDTDE